MEDHLHNENPVPHVILHEQEIATPKIIQAQSQREAAAGHTDDRDLFSERPDPSDLKRMDAMDTTPTDTRVAKRTRQGDYVSSSSTALVLRDTNVLPPAQAADAEPATQILPRELFRIPLEAPPQYLQYLKARGELYYQRHPQRRRLALTTYEVRIVPLRNAFKRSLISAVRGRYYAREAEMTAELEEIATLTADACMSAIYSKLRAIHSSYGRHGTRYAAALLYTKEVELPLPFALAIDGFGSFETHSLETNVILAPTYPEGTENEGRSRTEFNLTDYMSYIPTFKELGIPMKSVDTEVKAGSAWWTLRLRRIQGKDDLICTYPRSLYSDLSALHRMTLLAHNPADVNCINEEIIDLPHTLPSYGCIVRDLAPNSNIQTFLALCHGPEEEWSFGAI